MFSVLDASLFFNPVTAKLTLLIPFEPLLPFMVKKIKCSTSQSKHKLFIGNVPKTWGDEDLRRAVTGGPGVTGVELVKVSLCNWKVLYLVSPFTWV